MYFINWVSAVYYSISIRLISAEMVSDLPTRANTAQERPFFPSEGVSLDKRSRSSPSPRLRSVEQMIESRVQCDHRGASPRSFASLLALPIMKGEDLYQYLNDFCPVTTEDKVPSPELWSESIEYVPKWLVNEEYQGSEPGLIHIRKPEIFISDRTGVYFVSELPNKVIKYYKYCKNIFEPIDATVNEGFFMSLLADVNIAPHFYYYSGYIDEPYESTDSSKISHSKCKAGAKPHIRYLVMDEVGEALEETMFKFRDARFSFLTALKIGGHIINLIKTLYDFHIVHGDIHLGNLAFRFPQDQSEIIFLDFGRARIVGIDDLESDAANESFCTGKMRYDQMVSKWEMRSCKPTFRDDLYRGVQSIAYAIWGVNLRTELESLITAETIKIFEHVKDSARFFNSRSLGFSISTRVPSHTVEYITRKFDRISQIAIQENPSDPNEKPDYDGILDNLKAIIRYMYRTQGLQVDEENIFKLTSHDF